MDYFCNNAQLNSKYNLGLMNRSTFTLLLFGVICYLSALNCVFAKYRLSVSGPEVDAAGDVHNFHKTAVPDIKYNIEPYQFYNAFRLKVTLEFTGDKSGETKILLPDRYGGLNHLKGINLLKSLSQDTFIKDTDKPEEKLVQYPPNSKVVLTYQVEESRIGAISKDNVYHAVINKYYFTFLGETFFIIPLWSWDQEYNFHINWNNIPSDWTIANSFGANQKSQDVTIALGKFRKTIFTGGDFRIIQCTVNNNPVYISIRGNWKFGDADIANTIQEIIKAQRNFWQDNDFPYYFATICPIEGYDDYIGVKRINSFGIYLTSNVNINFTVKSVLSFEILQTWIWEKFKYASPEELDYWFSMGFSSYYARLLLLRAGMISIKDYVDDYNKVLENYFTSSARNEKNEKVVSSYWTDMDIHDLQFLRGDIIAHNLNAAIIKSSTGEKCLDNFILDISNRCENEDLTISNGSLSALIRFYAGDKALSDIMKTLNTGMDLKVNPDALGSCFKIEVDSYRRFWLIGEKYNVPYYVPKTGSISSIDNSCFDQLGMK